MNNKVIFIITIVVFWLFFVPTHYIVSDYTWDGWIKNALILGVIFYLRNDFRNFFEGEFGGFNKIFLFYCLVCILSIIVNADDIHFYDSSKINGDGSLSEFYAIDSPKRTIYYCLSLLCMVIFVERVSIEGKTCLLYRYLLFLLIPLVIWVDVHAFNHIVINGSISGYIVGTKFQACYHHFFLIIIYYLNHPYLKSFKEKTIMFGLIVVLWFLSSHTECSTMKMGALLFAAFLFLPKQYRIILLSGKTVVLSAIILGVGFFVFTSWTLQFEIVQTVIVDFLNEDMGLTGRLAIFENIMEAFHQPLRLAFGYGNGNSTVISIFYGCGHNPQNGLVEIFLNIGILGCMFFLAMMYQSFNRLTSNDLYKYPIVTFVYVMVFVSMIEVPFDRTFIFFIILLLADINEVRKKRSLNIQNLNIV